MSEIQQTHSLERTSLMGGPFIGRCVLCGKENLPSGAALQECANPEGLDTDSVIVKAITGEPSSPTPPATTGRTGLVSELQDAADVHGDIEVTTACAIGARHEQDWRAALSAAEGERDRLESELTGNQLQALANYQGLERAEQERDAARERVKVLTDGIKAVVTEMHELTIRGYWPNTLSALLHPSPSQPAAQPDTVADLRLHLRALAKSFRDKSELPLFTDESIGASKAYSEIVACLAPLITSPSQPAAAIDSIAADEESLAMLRKEIGTGLMQDGTPIFPHTLPAADDDDAPEDEPTDDDNERDRRIQESIDATLDPEYLARMADMDADDAPESAGERSGS